MVGEETKIAPDLTEEPTEAISDITELTEAPTDAEPSPESEKEDVAQVESTDRGGQTDFAELAKADMEALRLEFPELRDKSDITELKNPLRYAALRDLGLTPREAYLATSAPQVRYDNRSHLRSSVPSGARESAERLGGSELEAARELFSGLSDRELQKLYKKVIK